MRLVDRVLDADPQKRLAIYTSLTPEERYALDRMLEAEIDNPWAQYELEPLRFITEALGETVWSKQREIINSVIENQRTAVAACHAPGKALDVDTPVLTTRGWKRHGQLMPGDYVYGPDGQPTLVVAVTDTHTRPCFEVRFDDGAAIIAADRHEWTIRRGRGKHALRTIETQDMTDVWTTNGRTRLARYRLDQPEPVSGHHTPDGIDPYILGYWLGDGTTREPTITCHSADLPYLGAELDRAGVAWRIRNVEGDTKPVSLLRCKTLLPLGAKAIPADTLLWQEEARWALLAGLMDADGNPNRDGTVEITQKSATLAQEIVGLVRSLGEKATLRRRPAMLNGRQCGWRHTVSWTPTRRSPFRLPRKQRPLTASKRTSARSVVAVAPVGERLVSCIQVARKDGLYLAGEELVPTHNSWLSARIVSWWVAAHAPGTSLAITIAPTHRQVRNIIWPHIRRCHFVGKLPGEVLTSMWKVGGDVAAYGFSPSPYDEAATQGIHSPNLLIVVDEAGGIGEVVGQALEALMTGGNTRLLLLGNPPTDEEDSWFERCFNSPLYNPITISAYDTPNFTGEVVGLCKTCPPQVGDHLITEHLVDQKWVDDVTSEFGAESPFVEARVFARFPRSTANKVIPYSWCEKSADNEYAIPRGEIRLGVDVAADGGDEFVIARADGGYVDIVHRSSGQTNQNAVDVDRKVMTQLAGPTFKADSAGRIQIESKQEMKRRGVSSPDRAEAILLAVYEPPGREIPNVRPIGIEAVNQWVL